MLGTILEITLPIFYLLMATQWARYVAHTTRAEDEDRWIHSLLIGCFWPLAIPFYLALHESHERFYERAGEKQIEKRDAREDYERMVHRSLTRGRDLNGHSSGVHYMVQAYMGEIPRLYRPGRQ